MAYLVETGFPVQEHNAKQDSLLLWCRRVMARAAKPNSGLIAYYDCCLVAWFSSEGGA